MQKTGYWHINLLNIKRKILLLATTLICCFQVFSQTHVYKHYGVEDGLPSSEVYSAFQDSKGYMWFATDAGVSRFNGYEFENFDVSDGLTDNTVFLITEDHKGRIWFGTFNCKLAYYENDSIIPYEHNDKIVKSVKNKSAMISFQIDKDENIWMGFFRDGIYKCEKDGNMIQMVDVPKFYGMNFKYIHVNDGFVYGMNTNLEINIKTQKNAPNSPREIYGKLQGDDTLSMKLEEKYEGRNVRFEIRQFQDGYFISSNSCYFLKNNNGEGELKEIIHPPFMMEEFYTDILIDGNFILYSTHNGVYRCELIDNRMVVVDKYLMGKSVSRVFKDNRNGYWFQTLNDGVYYLSTREVKYLKTTQITAIEMDTVNGQLYLAYIDGSILKEKNDFSLETIAKEWYPSLVLKYHYTSKSLLLGWANKYFAYIKNDQTIYNKNIEGRGVKSFLTDGNTVYRGDGFRLSIIKNGEEIYDSYRAGEPKMWCSSMVKNGNDIWIGTKEGVKIYNNKEIRSAFSDNKYLSGSIPSMDKLSNGMLLIGTKTFGLLVVQNDSIIDIIGKKEGLLSNEISSIHIDWNQKIWIGNHKGMSSINYVSPQNYEIHNLTKYHGFMAGEIGDIRSYKDTIYAASSTGLYKFNKTKLTINKEPSNAVITHFYVNSKERSITEEINLTHEEKYINIEFLSLNYRNLGETEYHYRMLGVDTNWISTSIRSVQYPTMPPNDYIFEVKAKNEDGFWSEPVRLSFKIYPPIWLRWWVIVLEIFFGAITIYLLFKYRVKQLNFKNESAKKITLAEKRMVELELKALRSQMNPHFIFNTLNAIQNAINTLDKKVASSYIADFGRLIRIVLESSKFATIELGLEVKMLNLYVGLEAVRFSDKFTYNITCDSELNDDTYHLPTMVIQPFIENAILHGLVPQKGDDLKLTVNFKLKDDDTLVCIVEDNGIGRIASAELNKLKNLNKTSMGMEITSERLSLHSKELKQSFTYKIVDLVDDNNKSLGTKVELVFPL